MRHQRSEYLGEDPARGSIFVLTVAFLLLPYLVDVAFYGDFTATHFAQENLNDGEEDLFADGTASPCLTDTQAKLGAGVGLLPQDVYAPCSHETGTALTPQYLFVALLTSRPPPAL